jgi:hypothetical protein
MKKKTIILKKKQINILEESLTIYENYIYKNIEEYDCNKKLNICFSVDINECKYLYVLINSILNNTKYKHNIFFKILLDSDDTYNYLYKYLNCFNNINYRILNDNDIKFINDNKKVYHHQYINNIMNFARFWIGEYFDIDEYLYMDIDMIVQHDITDIFKYINIKQYPIWGVCIIGNSYIFYNNIPDDYITFNAGLYYTSNKYWKENDILNKIKNLMIEHKNSEKILFKLGTQPIINIIFYNNYGYLHFLWNLFDLYINTKYIDKAYVLHWNGLNKPWNKNTFLKNNWTKYDISFTVFKPVYNYSYNTNLFLNSIIEICDDLNINYNIVSNAHLIKNTFVIHYLASDFLNNKYINTSNLSLQLYNHINSIEYNNNICNIPSKNIKYYENKKELFKLFIDKKINIPKTFFIKSKNDLILHKNDLIKIMPVIVKHPYSCSSFNIMQFFNFSDLINNINDNTEYIIQQKINFTRELRITYINNHIFHGYYRIKNSVEQVSGASNHGSRISFDVDLNKYNDFIKKFSNATNIDIGGIDICWENNDELTEPFILEISPIFDLNPPSNYNVYSDYKKTTDYLIDHKSQFISYAHKIIDYMSDLNYKPIIYCDIDNTIAKSHNRIKKYYFNNQYKNYEHIINDEVFEHSNRILNNLYDNCLIIFITARKSFPLHNKSTEDWLYNNNFKYHHIIYTNNSMEKINFINSAKKHLFIDDLKINWENEPIDDVNMILNLNKNHINYIQFNNDWTNIVDIIYSKI